MGELENSSSLDGHRGYLHTKEGRERRYHLLIKQVEVEPLKQIRRFLSEHDIKNCRLKWITDSHYTHGGIYELRVKAIRDIDRIITRTELFLMTSIRLKQYSRYRERRQEGPNKIKFEPIPVKRATPSDWIEWNVVAVWIDAEGNLRTRDRPKTGRDYCLDISQKERAPLESIHAFLNRRGIEAKVFKRPQESYSLQVIRSRIWITSLWKRSPS
jgi:hypothetical protein